MNTSTRLLSSAVAAALLGSLTALAQAQTGNSAMEEESATYPVGGGTSTEMGTHGRAASDSSSSSAGTSGGGGSGMGTDAAGTAGSGNSTDAADMGTASPIKGSDVPQNQRGGKGSREKEKDREPHSSRGSDATLAGGLDAVRVAERSGATGGPMGTESAVSTRSAGSDAAGHGTAPAARGTSWLPYTSHGYVGGSLGQADFEEACVAGVDCDDPDVSGKIYTGGMFNEWLGAEVGWIHFGRADHGSGSIRAHGLNLSAVGSIPIPVARGAHLFAKLGTTYGWTRTSGGGISSESEDGFGLSWGVGASMDVAPNWAVTLEWERHRLEFVDDDEDVDLATLGVKYKF